jgi:RNA polymerase sigma factor (TIGR02999 family)
MIEQPSEMTLLLRSWAEGNEASRDRLMPMVEEELRQIAKRHMAKERPSHTLQPTALVNELYLQLVGRRSVNFNGRVHFFSTAAKMMRRILVDHARKRRADKRGGLDTDLPLEEALNHIDQEDRELIALDDGLLSLAKIHQRQSQAVELFYFAGLTYDEIGEVLGVSGATIKRDLATARAWLAELLNRF